MTPTVSFLQPIWCQEAEMAPPVAETAFVLVIETGDAILAWLQRLQIVRKMIVRSTSDLEEVEVLLSQWVPTLIVVDALFEYERRNALRSLIAKRDEWSRIPVERCSTDAKVRRRLAEAVRTVCRQGRHVGQ